MDDAPSRDQQPSAGLFRPFLRGLCLWRRARRAALRAEETYESARHQETPRDEAARRAFSALTGDDRPSLPEAVGTEHAAAHAEPDATPWAAPAEARSIPTA